jgi:hypothetical protein
MPQAGSYFDSDAPVNREEIELRQTFAIGIKDDKQQRTSASSYWSVKEESFFHTCLAVFGTENKAFEKISACLGTKTTHMVSDDPNSQYV